MLGVLALETSIRLITRSTTTSGVADGLSIGSAVPMVKIGSMTLHGYATKRDAISSLSW